MLFSLDFRWQSQTLQTQEGAPRTHLLGSGHIGVCHPLPFASTIDASATINNGSVLAEG